MVGTAGETGAPVVLVAVQPPLLGTTLARLLAGSGWLTADIAAEGTTLRRVMAAVVSQDVSIDLREDGCPLVVVLPDESGRNGRVLRAGADDEVFALGRSGVAAVLDLLAAERARRQPPTG